MANPIFSSTGDYPSVMNAQIAENSRKEGRLRSRLPVFSEKWINKIRGTSDFFGLNYYTSRYIEATLKPSGKNPSIQRDRMYDEKVKPEWIQSKSKWLYSVPQGLGDVLRYVSIVKLHNIFRRIT